MEIAIRLDTEDFLTPESDDALTRILGILDARGIRATFPVVAEKLRTWRRRGRDDLIQRLKAHAVGFHSSTHSLHPTIAEELAPLTWEEGRTAFAARERAGFDQVAAAFGPPACWTQPGGNWTAPALAVAREWGIPMEFSEGWNSYLDVGSAPCRFAGILHWSPPVAAPKPFLSGLPGNLAEAVSAIRAAEVGDPLCVVAHPTELCTTDFWDAVNFARGRMPPKATWRAAPVRTPGEVDAAAAALERYLDTLRRMGATFVTAREMAERYCDIAVGVALPAAAIRQLATLWVREGKVDAAVCGGMALSASEIFGLLVHTLAAAPGPRSRACAGPRDAPAAAPSLPSRAYEQPGGAHTPAPARPSRADDRPAGAPALPVHGYDGPASALPPPRGPAEASRDAVVAAARWCAAFLAEHKRLPAAVPVGTDPVPPATFAVAAAALVADPAADRAALRPAALAPAAIVKPPARLHWDWPIFPLGFAPAGLRETAILQSWTWKPAPPWPGSPDWRADRWRAAAR